MKCITNGSTIKRVKEEVALKQVNSGQWSYCPKSEWKKDTRNAVEAKEKADMDKAVTDLEKVTEDKIKEPKVHGLKAKDRRKSQGKKKQNKVTI